MTPSADLAQLLEIMVRLRSPDGGCAWDRAQTFETIAPYTIEEAYEVADAVARGDMPDLCDELGDLLLQVAYHAQLAEEIGAFAFKDVVAAVNAKMIRRHRHVFGTDGPQSAAAVAEIWVKIKAQEKRDRAARRGAEPPAGQLTGVPVTLPGLTRAVKLQEKASAVGFDWHDASLVCDKIREETAEVEDALASNDRENLFEEVGDLLFSVANLSRHLAIDPEAALRAGNAKFERRFAAIEAALKLQGRALGETDLAELEALWQAAKATEVR
jgi:ATP diphosphatase